MKVLLANAGASPEWIPPLGLASLNAHLRAHGMEVDIVDLSTTVALFRFACERALAELSLDSKLTVLRPDAGTMQRKLVDDAVMKLADAVAEKNADVVGFSVNFKNLGLSLLVGRELRERDAGVRIIFGGPQCHHILAGPAIAQLQLADAVIHGEAESSLLDLLESYRGGRARPIPGVTQRENGALIPGGQRPPIGSLDELECPDFSGLQLDRYQSVATLPLTASRGCPNRCTFCNVKMLWGALRLRSPGKVATDVETLVVRHGIGVFRFNDSLVNPFRGRATAIAEAFIDKGLAVDWTVNAVANEHLIAELDVLSRSGLKGLEFGVESPIPRLAREMKKYLEPKALLRILSAVKETGITVSVGIIVGWPTEAKAEFLQSLLWIYEHRALIDHVSVHRTVATPGASLVTDSERFSLMPMETGDNICATGTIPWRSPLVGPEDVWARYVAMTSLARELFDGNESPGKERIRTTVSDMRRGVIDLVATLSKKRQALEDETTAAMWYDQVTGAMSALSSKGGSIHE